ncbi:TlpA family protein disulfide reductase [Riemerella columbipharyngis]|uniref:Thioredoxin-like n=1 Tax=Riemerella columbipharyngis TaxID=1071918 RepID=A0A1G7DSB4_9FLAO|nr:thioredoxin-like domain-containing protein [Riemerella columbipharyngis]SDE54373.1 Thioredoxin-like [Riemerella columbipharyngis]
MKKIFFAVAASMSLAVMAQETPKVLKTTFSKKALEQKVTTLEGKHTQIKDILEKHKGKIVVLDFWASWCSDCVKAMPKAKELVQKNPDVDFIYLSLDRNETAWKKGIEKHHIENLYNYWFSSGWKNDFNNDIDLNWIPRYIVVNQNSGIAKYYAITPDDPSIQQTIDQLSKN